MATHAQQTQQEPESVTIKIELAPNDAWAAAQFFKRLGWQEIRVNAVSDDDAYQMRDALGRIREALNREGFDPR